MPTVSVVTPCYNSRPYLRDTVLSLCAQTLADWEQVIVDDGSTDGSVESVADLCEADRRVRVVRQPNRGVSAARNAGYRATDPNSRYVLFLDADDLLEPQMLATLAAYMDERPAVGLAYCDATFIDSAGAEIPITPEQAGWSPRFEPTRFGVRAVRDAEPQTSFVTLFAPATIIPSIALIRRSVYDQTPGWDESFGHLYEDLDVFLQLALRADVHRVPRRLVRYRKHPAQSTGNQHRIASQDRKLVEKWRAMSGLPQAQQAMVRYALWFREHRFGSFVGMRQAARLAREGRLGQAARFAAGSARRYAKSVLHPAPPLPATPVPPHGRGEVAR